eukprot:311843-Rhodomonas_salina.2
MFRLASDCSVILYAASQYQDCYAATRAVRATTMPHVSTRTAIVLRALYERARHTLCASTRRACCYARGVRARALPGA